MNKDDDEILDLVDKDDQVIGTVERKNKPKTNDGVFLRAAEVFLRNDKDEIWAPKRSLSKQIAPGGYDYSASGHVSSGETYEESLYREVAEELNLKIDSAKLKLLHKFAPDNTEGLFFRSVYLYETNETPDYNRDDFISFDWLKPSELLLKINSGAPSKRSLPYTLEFLIGSKLI